MRQKLNVNRGLKSPLWNLNRHARNPLRLFCIFAVIYHLEWTYWPQLYVRMSVLLPSMSWPRQQHQWLRMLSMASRSSWDRAESRLIRWRQGMTASSMMAMHSSTLVSSPLQNSRDALSFNACIVDVGRRRMEERVKVIVLLFLLYKYLH